MSSEVQKQNKKPIYQRTWFIALVVLLALSLISNAYTSDEPSTNEIDSVAGDTSTPSAAATSAAPETTATAETEPTAVEFSWPQMTEIVLEGTGDDVVLLDKGIPPVAAMDVVGNSASRYFGVRPILSSGNSGSSLVNTTDVFDGTVLLLGSGSDEIVGFEVSANGAWRFSIHSISDVPKLDKGQTYSGNGDGLVRLDETQGLTTISVIGNSEGRYFGVRPHGSSSFSVVNTTDPYDGRVRLEPGTLLLEVTAIGDWNITLE